MLQGNSAAIPGLPPKVREVAKEWCFLYTNLTPDTRLRLPPKSCADINALMKARNFTIREANDMWGEILKSQLPSELAEALIGLDWKTVRIETNKKGEPKVAEVWEWHDPKSEISLVFADGPAREAAVAWFTHTPLVFRDSLTPGRVLLRKQLGCQNSSTAAVRERLAVKKERED